ncbi:MAG: leucine-rich repeat protein [Thermoplasmatales archaeon]|nr:leucine-rich repeat protein [Thermoplasmatales archaeon]
MRKLSKKMYLLAALAVLFAAIVVGLSDIGSEEVSADTASGDVKKDSTTIGTWTYDNASCVLTLSANNANPGMPTELAGFSNQADVLSVILTGSYYTYGFKTDITSFFGSAYASLGENIVYTGDLLPSSSNTGTWTYGIESKALTITKNTASYSQTLPSYSSNNAPWYGYYFRTVCTHGEIDGYLNGGQYLFNGFSSMKTLTSSSMESIQYNLFLGSAIEVLSMSALIETQYYYSYSNYGLYPIKETLKTLYAPNLRTIASYSFHSFSKLETVNVDDDNVTVGSYAFYNCTKLNAINTGGIISIGEQAFRSCGSLTGTFAFPALTSVGTHSFYGCTGLAKVTDLGDIATIPAYLFCGCTSLTAVTIPNTAVKIGGYAFQNSKINAISLPDSVTEILANGFRGCGYLATVDLGNSLVSIGDNAFMECPNIAGTVVFPDTLTSVGVEAFSGSYNISGLTFTSGDVTTAIGQKAFYGCNNIVSVSFGTKIREIGASAFQGCTKLAGTVTFSPTITSVGNSAFYGCTLLVSVEFMGGDQLTSIGNHAFYNCTSLKTLVLGDKITSIGNYAFSGCQTLAGTVIFSPVIKTVGERAFDGCLSLGGAEFTGMYGGPSDVTALGNHAFYGCTSMVSLTLGDRIESIGTSAFEGCTGITGGITFPAALTTLGNRAFYGCTSLEDIDFNPNCKLKTISPEAFRNCKLNGGTIAFHNDLETIDYYAFYNCTGLEGISFSVSSSKLRTIQYGAFYKTEALGDVTFPDSLETFVCSGSTGPFRESGITGITFGTNSDSTKIAGIPAYAFYNCRNIGGTVAFPDNVTLIDNYAFSGCTSLEGISFNDTSKLATIGYGAFYGCTSMDCDLVLPDSLVNLNSSGSSYYGSSSAGNTFGNTKLSSVTFGSGLINIGHSAFHGLTSLTGPVELPASLEVVDAYAFYNCTNISELKVNSSNATLQTIGKGAFYNCASMEGDVKLPSSVTSIGQGYYYGNDSPFYNTKITKISSTGSLTVDRCAFRNCTALTNVSFPYATFVGSYAFQGCANLVNVNVSTIEKVESYTFNGCTSLKTVYIDSATVIDTNAFSGCTFLETAHTYSVETINSNAFYNCQKLEDIHLAQVGGTVGQNAFYNCSSLTDLDMPFATSIGASAFQNCSLLTGATLSSATSIGASAFRDCSSLMSVTASSVTSIGDYAFQDCSSLTGVTASSATSVGNYAFRRCVDLTSIEMDGLQTTGMYAFDGCTSLVTVEMPALTTLGSYAFSGCTSLQTARMVVLVTLNPSAFSGCYSLATVEMSSLTTMGSSAFSGCTSLNTIGFPALTTMGSSAFSGCTNLKTVSLPKVTTIGANGFQNCSNLRTVETSADLVYVGGSAFSGCPMLQGGLVLDSVTEIGASAFSGCASYSGDVNGIVDLISIKTLGDSAFYDTAVKTFSMGAALETLGSRALYNDGLETIIVDPDNLYFTVWENVLYNSQKTTALLCPPSTVHTSLALPDSVNRIESYSFYNTSNLTQVMLPNKVALTIGDYSFQNSGLTSLVLPTNITKIGTYAFANCTNLNSVVVEFIGAKTFINQSNPTYYSSPNSYQFDGCASLKSITYPNTVEIQYVFINCPAIEEIHITGNGASGLPSNYFSSAYQTMPWYNTNYNTASRIAIHFEGNVTEIDDYMFAAHPNYSYYNRSIEKVYITDSVTKIGNYAFRNCARLTEIVFPNNLTQMDANALQNCNALKKVSLPITFDWSNGSGSTSYPSVSQLTDIVFKPGKNGVGFDYTLEKTNKLFWKSVSSYKISFESGVTHIGDYSYLKPSGFITIPSTVESIGEFAFYRATIQDLTIEDGLKTLEDNAFSECTNLTFIRMPNTFQNYNGSPFNGCTSVSTVYLPITLEYTISEDKSLFFGCSSLYMYHFTPGINGVGVTYTADKAVKTPWYDSCEKYNKSINVTFSEDVVSVGNYMFYGCAVGSGGLEGNLSFPDSLKSIGESSFQNCTLVTGVTFGNTLDTVGKNAFAGCTGIKALTFASTDTTFGDGAFKNCSGMKTLTVPVSFNTVGNVSAPIFEGCTGLETVNLVGSLASHNYSDTDYQHTPWHYSKANTISLNVGGTVSSIGNNMFRDCTGLTGELTITPVLTNVGTAAFAGCSGITKLTVQSASANMGPHAFRDCIGIATLSVPAAFNSVKYADAPIFENCGGITKLFLTGSGSSIGYSDSDCRKTPWYYSRGNSITLSLAPTITTVGGNVFRDSGIAGVVTIGNNISSVENNAFGGSAKITGLVITSSATSLGRNAFGGCTGLASLTLPVETNTVKYADAPIFGGCFGINELHFTGVLGFSYTESGVGDYRQTPWYLSRYNTITADFATGVREIGNNMFRGCTGLDGTVALPSSVNTVGDYAFNGCTGLDRFEGVEVSVLKAEVFRGSSSLSYVSLPLVTTIPEYTFEGCTGLSEATVGSCKTIGGHAFENSGINTINSAVSQTANLAGVTSVGDYAFAKSGLVDVVLGTSGTVLTMGDYVFLECQSLTTVDIRGELIRLPANTFRSAATPSSFASPLRTLRANGVKTFAANLKGFASLETVEIATATSFEDSTNKEVFRGCVSLKSITLFSNPDSPVRITLPESAFRGCVSLLTVDATNLVLSRGHEFRGCISLNDVTVAYSTQIPDYAFSECAALTNFEAPCATAIGNRSFEGCGFIALTSGVLPNATSAGEYAFAGCPNLASVDLPLTAVGKYAFSGCNSLGTVTLSKIQTISEGLFHGCASLNGVSAEKARTVGVLAFYGNVSLMTVNLQKAETVGDVSEGAVELADYDEKSVFGGCDSLGSVSMPSLKKVGALAFYGCAGLSRFNSDTEMDLSRVSFIGYGAFYGTAAVKVTVGYQGTELKMGDFAFAESPSLTGFTVLGGLAAFGKDTLDNCPLLERLKLPISVRWVSDYKPTGIKGIEFTRGTVPAGYDYTGDDFEKLLWNGSPGYSVTFEQGISKIGDEMRLAATGDVFIPRTVISVGKYAFWESPMTSLVIENGTQALVLNDRAFGGCESLTEIAIPNNLAGFNGLPFCGCTALSKATLPITFDFSGKFGNCTALSTFVFTVGSNGIGHKYTSESSTSTPWYAASGYGRQVSVSFAPGVKSIGDYMFCGCTAVTGPVELVESVTAVGAHAFEGAAGMTELHIRAAAFGTLGESAFKGCTGLKTLTIPLTVDAVVSNTNPAFGDCTSVTSISFIGNGAGFAYADPGARDYKKTPWYLSRANSITVAFGDGITEIGNNTFRDCTGLNGTVILPDATTAVGDRAFNGCTGLSGFNGPKVTSLGIEVFRGSTALSSVSLPLVTTIPESTFEGCAGLSEAEIASCTAIGKYAFRNSGVSKINSLAAETANLTGVSVIGEYAFAESGLVKVTAGTAGTALVLEDYAFLECASLKEMNIDGIVAKLPYNTFRSADTDATFVSQLRTLRADNVTIFAANLENFASLKTVSIVKATSFDENNNKGVFKGCVSLESIALFSSGSSTQITLPESAFEGCVSLTAVDTTNLALSKGSEFRGCVKLDNVIVYNSVRIPNDSFRGCAGLKTFTTASATSVGNRSFEGCGFTALTTEVLPNVISVGEYAFAGCPNLTSVNLPLTAVGKYAFSGCATLGLASLPEIQTISEGLFHGCTALNGVSAEKATTVEVLAFSGNAALASINLQSVRAVGDVSGNPVNADNYLSKPVFGGCTSLGSVTMPALRQVGALAFYGCTGLSKFNSGTEMDLSGITFIGYGAFYNTAAAKVTVGKPLATLTMKDYAFAQSQSLTGFTVSGGLESFEKNTFDNCPLLENLKIPISAKWISDYKPVGVKSIQFTRGTVSAGFDYVEADFGNLLWSESVGYSVTFEQGITKIGNRMYLAAAGAVTVPSSVISIGEYAFCGSPMTSVVMHNGLQNLGDGAFCGCTSLTEVTVPGTLVNFQGAPFSNCTALSKVTLPITTDFSKNMFEGCGALNEFAFTTGNNGYGKGWNYDEVSSKKTPWYLASSAGISVSFGSGIETIGNYMFYGCKAVTGTVDLVGTITAVGDHAFDGASNISAINIESNDFKTPGKSAFKDCFRLAALKMPLKVNAVGSDPGNHAFEGCTSITSIEFIGYGAGFAYADSGARDYKKTPWYLSRANSITVTFGDGITEIGNNTFRDCTGIAGDVDISLAKTVGEYAFSGCSRMTGITGNSVTTLGTHAFEGSTYLTEAVMPVLTSIPDYAFAGCSSMADATFTACISLGAHAFENSGINNINNDGADRVVDFSKVNTVGDNAFARSEVVSIILGTSGKPIVYFGERALFECDSLKDVVIAGSLPKLPRSTFRDDSTNPSFASGLNSVTANETRNFAANLADNFRSLQRVEVRGATSFDADNNEGVFRNCESLTTVILYSGDTAVYLPKGAFRNCVSLVSINLESVNLSKGYEFYGCKSLNNVALTKMMDIPEYSFYGCSALESFSAPKASSVGKYSFSKCGFTAIDGAMFEETEMIGEGAFAECASLISVNMPAVTSAGRDAFRGCSVMENATFAILEEISLGMFRECGALKNISADSVTKIRESAFYGCRALESVVMNSVTEIGDVSASTGITLGDYENKAVFYNCVSLGSVTMPAVRSVGALAFYGCSTLESFNADGSMDLSDAEVIRYGAFAGTGFREVSVGKTGGIREIGDYAFYGCARLRDFSSVSLVTLPEHLFNNTDISLPSASPMLDKVSVPAVVSFNANLHGCKSLTKVSAPNATSFCDAAFRGCTQLKTVELMNNPARGPAVVLSKEMFYECENLVSVTFTNVSFYGGLTQSERVDTFKGCKSLVYATLPEAAKIPVGAFSGCILLSSVNMPKATEICANAFEGCVSLVSAEMPVASKIGYRAFAGCSSLASVNNATGRAPFFNVVEFGEEAFKGCAFTGLVLGPSTTKIGVGAFIDNPASEIVIPNVPGFLTIDERAFKGCPAESIHISSSVREIRSNAFDCAGTNVTTAKVWFNGTVTDGMLQRDAFVGNQGMALTVNVNSFSGAVAENFVTYEFVTGGVNVTVNECPSATIQFGTDEAGVISPSNGNAIYGGKIVLPSLKLGDVRRCCGFATVDSNNVNLALFASEADYAAGKIAKSGDAVPMYPIGTSEDAITLFGTTDTSGFLNEMEIVTQSYGMEVNLGRQTVHYGSEIIMPRFVSSLMKARELTLVKGDGATYPLDPETTTSVYAGYYFVELRIVSEDAKIDVIFVSKGVTETVSVNVQAPFSVPAELKYMETEDPGFRFMGWYSADGGKGIRAGSETRFSPGQAWYAYFTPLGYTITIVSDSPAYSHSVEVTGPFTLHTDDDKSLYYTDLTTGTAQLPLFSHLSIPGWSVSYYGDKGNHGREITGDYGTDPKLTGDMIVDLYMTMNVYDVSLKFRYNHNDIPSDEEFFITGLGVGVSNVYHTGDRIEGIPYSEIENGLALPVPKNHQYSFRELYSVDEKGGRSRINYENERYALFLANFGGGTSVTLEFAMDMGRYIIEFDLDDDGRNGEPTVFTYQDSLAIGEFFLMPSVQRNYFKTGYTFKGLKVVGDDTLYGEREPVELTQEMIDLSKSCVVSVKADWEKISYTIEFDLRPHTGTVDALEGVKVDDDVTFPSVSGYTGYRVSGWSWSKGGDVSEPFADGPKLTKEIIDRYAEGRTISLKAEWAAKTYTLKVDPATSYKFEVKTVVYGESFTLWTNIYTRAFVKFAGWTVGDEVYGNSALATLNETMAAIGDESEDVIIFGMKWISSEYQIRYDLDGGTGTMPYDDKPYIIDETDLVLAADDGSFYRDGYTFIGWKYSRLSDIQYVNLSGKFESALAQNADSDNVVTLYAMWSQKSYKIEYNFNGGRAGAGAPVNVLYGDEVVISNPYRSGYDFAGWTASNLTNGAMYGSSSGFRFWDGLKQVTSKSFRDLSNVDESTVTFTAHWRESTYLMTYDLNGGSGIIIGGMTQIRLGDGISLPTLRDASKIGHTFRGWGVDPVNAIGNGTVFTADMVKPEESALALYAVWAPVEYTVQYRFADTYRYSSITSEYGESVNVPILERSGFDFDGWDIVGADSTAYYGMNGKDWYKLGDEKVSGTYFKNLTPTGGGVITLNATWVAKNYRIEYRPNGGTGAVPIDDLVYHVGDSVEMKDFSSLSGTNGSKSVVGWSLEPDGAAMTVRDFTEGLAEKADATNAINLYAVWVDGMCLISINLDGCTPSKIPSGWSLSANGTYDKLVEYGTETKTAMADWDGVTLHKDGYTFDSWEYGSSTVTSTVEVSPNFEKVDSNIMYVFAGVISAFVVGAVVYSRLGR